MPIGRRSLLAGSTALSLFAPPAWSQPAAAPPGGREALLIPGKRSLRQRVLTRPGAAYRAQPGSPAGAAPASPLTPLYVFARQAGPDGKPWLEVGAGSRGATLGWLPEEQSIPWLHTMTAAFHNPVGRERTLFFRDRESLLAMLGGAAPAQEARLLTAAAQRTPRPENFPVVAMEPAWKCSRSKEHWRATRLPSSTSSERTSTPVTRLPAKFIWSSRELVAKVR